jgi:dTDP-glucose 4,6-dehydratase
MRVLVTGGCGFLGSHFVRRLVAAGDEVVVLDRLLHFGQLANLEGVPHEFVQGDVADAVTATGAADGCDAIVNFAAETRLDSPALAAGGFIVTDAFGTHVLLEFARVAEIRFVQVSTDEAREPATPPGASKAAADLQVLAYVRTHGLNASITRGARSYGPFQHPDEPIPRLITGALEGQRLSVGSGGGEWLHAEDHCAAIELVVRKGEAGSVYGIEGERRSEHEVAERIVELSGEKAVLATVPDDLSGASRPPADDGELRALGWRPGRSLDEGLAETVEWYRARRDWWEPLRSGSGGDFAEQYARRTGA